MLSSGLENQNRFTCRVSEDGFLASLGKAIFGFQDLEIGDAALDRRFIIRGDDEPEVRRLFALASVRRLLMHQRNVVLSVGLRSVRLESSCTDDPDLMLRLFELMYEVIAHLDEQ